MINIMKRVLLFLTGLILATCWGCDYTIGKDWHRLDKGDGWPGIWKDTSVNNTFAIINNDYCKIVYSKMTYGGETWYYNLNDPLFYPPGLQTVLNVKIDESNGFFVLSNAYVFGYDMHHPFCNNFPGYRLWFPVFWVIIKDGAVPEKGKKYPFSGPGSFPRKDEDHAMFPEYELAAPDMENVSDSDGLIYAYFTTGRDVYVFNNGYMTFNVVPKDGEWYVRSFGLVGKAYCKENGDSLVVTKSNICSSSFNRIDCPF